MAAGSFDDTNRPFLSCSIRSAIPPTSVLTTQSPHAIASTTVTADLSAPGAKVKYELFNASLGDYDVWGFLDDNGNAFPLLPMADAGDLLPSKVKLACRLRVL